MATVTLKHISKIFGEKTKRAAPSEAAVAVRDFCLEVADREFVVLVGPSGCGKSTTLRMIAGLEEITSGELFIDGKLVNDVEPKDRDVAMVFQNYALYPHMTVYDNIAFPLKLRKLKKDEIRARVEEVARILDITEFLGRKPKQLSGGQRQRVAIGRAIVREPKVLLMDEPLSNLDAKLRNQMRAEIIALREKIDTTFLYVTHDQTEAMTLGDRIVVMKDGVVQQDAAPQEAFDHPNNQFVAGFIGLPRMNFFPARLEKDGDGYAVRVGEFCVPLTKEKSENLRRREVGEIPVTLGVRPDALCLTDDGNAPGGTIRVCEMMGTQCHLHVDMAGEDVIVIIPAAQGAKEHCRAGNAVRFAFSGADCHLFGNDGGNLER